MQSFSIEELTPKQVINFLDKYIIGQEKAKKSLAIVLRNRWRRQQVKTELREEITPRNILMIGPTGVGKTEIARRVARLIKAPFIKVEASKFTEVGYVGRDVESIIRDLTEISINLVREEKLAQVQITAKEQAFHRVVECMLPGIKQPFAKNTISKQTDIKHTEAKKMVGQQADLKQKEVKKKGTAFENKQQGEAQNQLREKFYQKVVSGSLDERLIEIEVKEQSGNFVSVEFMPMMGEELDSLRDNFTNLFPKKKKNKKFKVKDAIKYFQQEEAEKLIDQENINKIAIERVEESGIVFIDEIDKIVGKEDHHKGDISGEGVQRDLLPIVEGTSVRTKYGTVLILFFLLQRGLFILINHRILYLNFKVGARFFEQKRPCAYFKRAFQFLNQAIHVNENYSRFFYSFNSYFINIFLIYKFFSFFLLKIFYSVFNFEFFVFLFFRK